MDRSREDIRRPGGIVYTAQVGTKPGSLLLRHAGSLDHLRPFVDVAAQPRTKLLRCAAFGFNAKLQCLLLHFGESKGVMQAPIEDIDDVLRRAGAGEELHSKKLHRNHQYRCP